MASNDPRNRPTSGSQLPTSPPSSSRWLRSLCVVAGLAGVLATGVSAADPAIRFSPTPMGAGLTRYGVDVDFQDGLGKSGFVQVTFLGPFDAQTQLTAGNWPDLQVVQTSANQYMLQGGTGGGSSVDVVEVGQLVVPTGQSFSYNAVISRNGQNFTVVPEPAANLLGAAGIGMLGLLTLHRGRGST